ncbi:metal ABC transporter permease [Guyparkeria hydrothermalis]|uniref:metal ABC transporter permease n=1 Tax=Guyparkeria hydrothermalis TaxID=923 RepID=UPI00202183C1|nr:metal ABC transporter permease [Guyparkeria hydrothermalis]
MSFVDLFSQGFVQHALIAAVLVSIAAGIVGALVVVNRLVFMTGGIAHTAYGGVGTAIFLGLPVLPVTGLFTAAAALLLGGLTIRRRERTDTLIGVIWAAGMAFGLILVDLTPGYQAGLMTYLFGSILTVGSLELWLMAGIDALILGLALYYYRDLLSFSFDPVFARTRGIPVTGLYLMLLLLIAETVVMMIQVVGLLLVIALLTLPPYLAQRYTRTLGGMMLASGLFSLLFCLTGLYASYWFDIGSGPAIIATASLLYLSIVGIETLLSRASRA